MLFTKFTPKQKRVLTWYIKNPELNGIICEGAVRSGKTMCMSLSFVQWATATFNNRNFAICSKSVNSARRNITNDLLPALCDLGMTVKETKNEGKIEISLGKHKNFFFLFGGNDEKSSSYIQGITLAGVLLDEVVLMPEDFVNQAIARCSVKDSKLWFNCNPSSQSHWFYTNWIQKAKEKNLLCVHFSLDDNPSLDDKTKQRYHNMYTDVFYDRYILGKWVNGDGLVYDFFTYEKNVADAPTKCEKYVISCDYGTKNPFSLGLWGLRNDIWYRVDEFYFDSKKELRQKCDEQYYEDLKRLAGNRKIDKVIVDPSASSFIECIRFHAEFNVVKAVNNVLDGIRKTSVLLREGKIVIDKKCVDFLREISLYEWDDRSGEDKVKKENDHAMDDMRYFVSTVACINEDEEFAFVVKK